MSDAERDKTLVQELLELKAKVDGIIERAFKNNAQFQSVVREGFESVVNRRQNKPAELIGTMSGYFLPLSPSPSLPSSLPSSSLPLSLSFPPSLPPSLPPSPSPSLLTVQQSMWMFSCALETRSGQMRRWRGCWTRSWSSSDSSMVMNVCLT